MVGILIILGILALAVGFLSLTEATLGVGIVGLACFLGILARIAQAHEHWQDQEKLLQGVVVRLEAEDASEEPARAEV